VVRSREDGGWAVMNYFVQVRRSDVVVSAVFSTCCGNSSYYSLVRKQREVKTCHKPPRQHRATDKRTNCNGAATPNVTSTCTKTARPRIYELIGLDVTPLWLRLEVLHPEATMTPVKPAWIRHGYGAYYDPRMANIVVEAPLVASVMARADELSAMAKIGAEPAQTPGGEVELEGFDHFVPALQRDRVLEGRLDASGRLLLRPGTPGHYPEPSGSRTVVVGVGRDGVTYTAARHWIDGENRFGQDSAALPFCLVNLPAWRRTPCDLRSAEWYPSEDAAIAKYAPLSAPELTACVATFPRGVQIELRHESGNRWLMWEVCGLRRVSRADFSSPYLDHAKRAAELWYGQPVTDWQELKHDGNTAARRKNRRNS
jgi:hypothetical protein